MFHNDFEYLLEQAIGLDTASIGASAVERAVKERMSIGAESDVHAYWNLVRCSSGELQALIEAVVVPETWFFRNAEAFAELARIALEEWLPHRAQGTLRVLSLPCSTGEEPYSMAMALCDAGFALDRCRIDAIDVSTKALEFAQSALYGKNSFRGTDLGFRDRFFDKAAVGYRCADAVRSAVHFQQGNLFSEGFLPGAQIYDIIFCRNLLIYFSQTTQDRAVRILERLLKPQGALFVGPPEGSLLLNHGFISHKVPLAFAFRRGGEARGSETRKGEAVHGVLSSRAHTRLAKLPGRARPSPAPEPAMKGTSASESPLDEAFRLADLGHMADAAESCAEDLRRNGPSAAAYFLMGLIRTAAGSLREAEQQYRRALYLDRNHHETLVHLHLLLEKQGDTQGAQALRERIVRLNSKGTGVV
jgi:chemotaxis protein methyltransferase WspC